MDVSITARPVANAAIGTSSGNYSTASATFVTVCSVTITASGRPIQITLQHDASANPVFYGVFGNATNSIGDVQVLRGATQISQSNVGISVVGGYSMMSPGSVTMLDTTPGIGSVTYTFKIQAQAGGAVFYARYVSLAAVEL